MKDRAEISPLVFRPDEDGKVSIACPSCGHVRVVDGDRFPDPNKVMRVKCVCGDTFACRIDAGRVQSAEPHPISNKAEQVPDQRQAMLRALPEVACSFDERGLAQVVCPHCDTTKYLAKDRFDAKKTSVSVRCGCGKPFVCRILPELPAEAVPVIEAVEAEPVVQEQAPPQEQIPSKDKKWQPLVSDPKPENPEDYWSMTNADIGSLVKEVEVKFYADKEGDIAIVCPKCSHTRNMEVKDLKHIVPPVKISCVCGNVFHCLMEFRRTYRKEVSLQGEYTSLKDKHTGKMMVQDLSIEGLGFRTLVAHELQVDDIVEVKFQLDDRSESIVRRQARVKSTRGRFIIGAMFANLQYRDKALGFYLMA